MYPSLLRQSPLYGTEREDGPRKRIQLESRCFASILMIELELEDFTRIHLAFISLLHRHYSVRFRRLHHLEIDRQLKSCFSAVIIEERFGNSGVRSEIITMARRSQYVFLAVLFVVAAASAALVYADEAAPTIAEQAEATKKTATEEAAPTIKEKIEAVTETGKKQTAQLGETVQSWREWAMKRAGDFTGKGKATAEGTAESAKAYGSKGAESFHKTNAQAQESASGMYNKWSSWAKETAGKYKPKKNPAAEAAAYINKHTTGAKENEEL